MKKVTYENVYFEGYFVFHSSLSTEKIARFEKNRSQTKSHDIPFTYLKKIKIFEKNWSNRTRIKKKKKLRVGGTFG